MTIPDHDDCQIKMIECNLPEPDPDSIAHSLRVAEAVHRSIDNHGPMSFGEYMQLVLYAPGLGYYMGGAQKFGASGDFVTAPETSSLFGACLAGQTADVLEQTGGDIVELGAGSGALALSMLQHLITADRLPDRYRILEPSAELADRQRALLENALPADVFALCSWLDSLPDRVTGVVVANEVMDAMPVERFVLGKQPDDIQQIFVDHRNAGLELVTRQSSHPVHNAVTAVQESLDQPLPPGYCSEINLVLSPWLQALGDSVDQGLLLLIDYGYPRQEYYFPERSSGTLRCYFRHRVHEDALLYPGLQDITCDVDFTLLAIASEAAGFDLHGYTTQAQFLLGSGLIQLAESANGTTTRQRVELGQQTRALTHPSHMGERFQVMGLSKQLDIDLRGFSTLDLCWRL